MPDLKLFISQMELNWADYTILGVIAVSALVSFMRGFVKEAISLASLVLAVWVMLKYMSFVADYLTGFISTAPLRLGVAAAILFIAVLIIGVLVNHIVGKLVDKAGFSGINRALGAFFGVLKGGLIVVLVVTFASLTPLPRASWWTQSYFLPMMQERIALYYKAHLAGKTAANFNVHLDPGAVATKLAAFPHRQTYGLCAA